MKNKIIILIAYFIFIYSLKYLIIENYAVNVPFGDQWDSEAFYLYKPYIENNLHFYDFFSQHNEHRIFCTRVLNLLIYILNNNKWDTILTMKVQALILCLIPTFLLFHYLKYNKNYSYFTIIFFIIIFTLPIGYENLLWGFQSQFYFMIFFSIISFYLATSPVISLKKIIFILVLCLLSYLNIASGFITSIIVSFIFYFRFIKTRKNNFLIYSILLFIEGSLFFIFIIPVQAHLFLKSQNFSDFIDSLDLILQWPFKEFRIMFILLWIPLVGFLFNHIVNYKKIKIYNIFYISILIWIIIQLFGISYARGGNILTLIQNRYTDIFLLSEVSMFLYIESTLNFNNSYKINFYNLYKLIFIIIFCHYSFVNFYYFKKDFNKKQSMLTEINHLYKTKSINQMEALIMLNKSTLYKYPYPFKDRLWMFINDKTINKILPNSIITK